MDYKLSVIVPVYNEKDTISVIIERLLAVPELNSSSIQYVIVDDGSTDGTADILRNSKFRSDSRFVFILNEKNQGKGFAIRCGLAEAAGEYTVIQDADLEYDPKDIVKILNKAESEKLAAVYGSRCLDKKGNRGAPLFYFGGKLVTAATNILYGQKLTDEPTCYKLFRTDFLKSLPLVCKRFEFCPEVTALAAKNKIKIAEVPISYFPRNSKGGKKIRWQDGLEAIWTLLRLRFDFKGKYAIASLIFLFALSLYMSTWQRAFGGYEGETVQAAWSLLGGHYEIKRAGLGAVILYLPFIALGKILPLGGINNFSFVPAFYSALTCGIIYLIMAEMGARRYMAIAVSVLIAAGSIIWPYANMGMEYQAMFWISLLLLSLLRWGKDAGSPWLIGIFLAFLAIAKSYGIVMGLPAVLFIYASLEAKNRKEQLFDVKFLFKLFFPVIALYSLSLLLCYFAYGSISGAYSLGHEFQIWTWWEGFYGIFFSAGKSIFIYNPLLILALWYWPAFYRKHKPLSLFILSSFVLLFLITAPFSYWTDETWGVRKLVPIIPLLHLPLLMFLEDIGASGKRRIGIKLSAIFLALISIYVQLLGASYSYGKCLNFLRENNLDSLQSMRYIPQFSQVYMNHNFLMSYLDGAFFKSSYTFKYDETSWLRSLQNTDDIVFKEIRSNLREFNKPDIVWLNGAYSGKMPILYGILAILLLAGAVLAINCSNDYLERTASSGA